MLAMKNNHQLLKRTISFRIRFFLILIVFLPIHCFSQIDTTKRGMSFDFGLTRDRNINLWPIYKRTISEYEKDKQLLFPIYRSYQNKKVGEMRSHILPLFWKDSSKTEENSKFISLFYPSLVHLSKDKLKNTKTFTLLEFAPRINLLEFKKSPDGLVMQNNLLFFLWFQNNQITKRSHLVVFPAYWQFKSPVKETTTVIPFYSYGNYMKGKNHYRAITPLYWHFQSPKRKSNLLFPLWWNRNTISGKDSTSSNLLFPIYWSYKNRYTNNKVFFPIAWSIQNVKYKSLTIPPLFSYGYNQSKDRQHLIVTPLYWHFKRYESESTALFPIIWKSTWKTKYENFSSFVVFPLYWQQQNNNEQSRIILPFVWSKITPYYSSFSFIPLLSIGHSPDKNESHTIVTPLFWHYKSFDNTSNTLFPIWWNKTQTTENGVKRTNVVFPLYYGKRDTSYQSNIFFPFIWNFKSPDYHTFIFVPFFGKGQSTNGKESYLAISPLYWTFKTDYGKTRMLFPFWWQNDKTILGEIKSSSRVILLYWKYKDSERKHQGVLPLVWKLQNRVNKSFTFFPLYTQGQALDSTRKYLAITPLFWHLKNQERTFNTLFPIWWKRDIIEGENPRHFSLLLPVYLSKRDNYKSKKILFPIIWSLKNLNYQSFTFVPLFSTGHSLNENVHHLAITPLFWYFRNTDGHSASLIPLFWNSKYGDGESAVKWNVIFPIYWSNKDSEKNNHIFAPLLWSLSNSHYRSFTFAPLFSIGHSSDNSKHHTVITPIFWHLKSPKSKTNTFLPIWWSSSNESPKGLIRTNILFPIYWSFSKPLRTTKIVFPLAWTFNNPKSRSFTLVPLYSHGTNSKGTKHLMISPLFWKFDSNIKHQKILFPLFTSYSDTSKRKRFDVLFFLIRHNSTPNSSDLSILWPIIAREKSTDYQYFRFAPLVWSKKSSTFSYFTFQPFFYRSTSKEHETIRLLWELFVHRNQIGIKRSNSILWKVVTWDRFTNGDHEFRLLHLLYSNSHVDGHTEKSLFPLYFLTKGSNGNRSLSVMLYFYNSIKRQVPNTKEFYQEDRIFWLIRIRSNYKLLKQKGIKVDSVL